MSLLTCVFPTDERPTTSTTWWSISPLQSKESKLDEANTHTGTRANEKTNDFLRRLLDGLGLYFVRQRSVTKNERRNERDPFQEAKPHTCEQNHLGVPCVE